MNWLESLLDKLGSLLSNSPDGKLRREAEEELKEAEEYLETAENFESNIDNERFLKHRAKGSREKAEEIIENKIKQATNHIVKAEEILENITESSRDLEKVEESTEKARRLAESIDSDLEIRDHGSPYS